MSAIKAFYTGKPICIGRFDSTLSDGEVIIIAKMRANKKTGLMIQLAFLDPSIDQKKIDPSKENGQGCDKRCTAFEACYVQAFAFHIGSIQHALDDYNSGKMEYMLFSTFLALVTELNLPVRFGEFGDPSSVDYSVIKRIADACGLIGHTGYTHHWRSCDQRLKNYFMASVENQSDYELAKSMGWRCFFVGGLPVQGESITCLNSSANLNCVDCKLCAGTKFRFDVVIDAHGRNAKKIASAS
jgi:hypothetical protein